MDWEKLKEIRKTKETNHDRFDFSWEKENCPVLHSGFATACSGDPSKSQLFLSLWFDDGEYQLRLADREADLHAFISVGSLSDIFVEIEQMITKDDLRWKRSKRSNGKSWEH